VQRAINREPVIEEEWPYDDGLSFKMLPVPGGCIMVGHHAAAVSTVAPFEAPGNDSTCLG
jgi:hypothetical protein